MTSPQSVADRIGLVVSSCDDFCDTWRPFAYFFAKFWPDCPFKTYLIVNNLLVTSDFLEPIAVGGDRGWASNFRYALARIPHDHVLYLQDDYFIEEAVDTEQVLADCAWCIEHGVDSLCFSAYPEPQPGFEPVTERFGRAPRDSDGRTRCQFALWKKSALLEVLRDGETAWDMESRGSERTTAMNVMVYTSVANTPMRYLASAIVRSLWTPEALAMCDAHGVPIRPRVRGVLRPGKQMKKARRAFSRFALRLWVALRRGAPIDLRRDALLSPAA
jgi:hypothetical protein